MGKLLEKNQFLKKLKSIKHIEVYIAIIFIIVLAGIFLSDIGGRDEVEIQSTTKEYSTYEYASYLENKLEKVLSNINGAGSVSVMVSVESSSEIVYATTTEEKTNSLTSGSTTTITSQPIIITSQGSSKPIVVKEYMPKINGVIVVAQGAGDVSVRLELQKAVLAILDVPTTNIEILVGNK